MKSYESHVESTLKAIFGYEAYSGKPATNQGEMALACIVTYAYEAEKEFGSKAKALAYVLKNAGAPQSFRQAFLVKKEAKSTESSVDVSDVLARAMAQYE